MQLDAFRVIDEIVEGLENDAEMLQTANYNISKYFHDIFVEKDYFLNINSRIKTSTSIKEKILRQNLYLRYKTSKEIMDYMPDLIGVRIECRFKPDEKSSYEVLLDRFSVEVEKGYFTTEDGSSIYLKLDELQPQHQQNGFEIYKMDGHYITKDGERLNFELQIKSLVNVFWGDIEHKILYKNYTYLMGEKFIIDMMNSINENLSLIDKQLSVVYDHVYSNETYSGGFEEIKEVLKKAIYDKYFEEIRKQLGFVMDFRSLVDLIVDFVFFEKTTKGEDILSSNFINLLVNINKVGTEVHRFDETIDIPKVRFSDQLSQYVAQKLGESINEDFRWNLLFRIIFEISDNEEDIVFKNFVNYLVDKFRNIAINSTRDCNMSKEQEEEVQDYVLDTMIKTFYFIPNVEKFDEESFRNLAFKINSYVMGLGTYANFMENKDKIRDMILELGK